ncbi:arylsulfatase J-like isoform X2 [Littorina saxatilis]|uniref:Sulfatase N-terminal domain-containing protein n=1 Tax=Littorina saxatilis TaxID=31220 RepID=A0AAN9G9J4_9CAEN
MSRTAVLKVLGVAAVALLALKLLFMPSPKAPYPHIIFIVADDLGWNDVSWHNPQVKTPNLEKYARAGVILNSSYVAPVCSPSRASFMTGYYAHRTGLQHIPIIHFKEMYLPSRFTLLPELLKQKGYATHLVGKWHLGFCNWRYTPRYRGFDSFLGYYGGQEGYYNHSNGKVEEGYDLRDNEEVLPDPDMEYGMYILNRGMEKVIAEHDKTQPLFLFLSYQSVHSPLEAPQRFVDLHPEVKNPNRKTFNGMISVLDEAFGNATAALQREGLLDNALIIFTSDNGGSPDVGGNNWPLRGGKFSLWEGGTRVPAFVYSKNLLSKTGYTNNEFIHAVDWFPTMLNVAGIKPNDHLDGISQWETLKVGRPSFRKEFIYNIDEVDQNGAIRVGDFKLIKGEPGRFFDWFPVPSGDEVAPTQYPTWKRRPWTPKMFPDYQLFNISADPEERHNLADDFPEVVQQLKQKLTSYERLVVPSQHPPVEPKSLPHNFGGVWTPGWCD